ncbi:hypothetical protein LEP1GSC062_0632 [Leptospira alexanderi serovar Manhao 3 str. L 60]|uniref:Uncharacterized protein n=1 Tax=Leptospira alexanderi serovar Manhao 3 str. L 60 TaxID=1049759 RepID=V6HUW3_9LEPT|nr:hypothetical protein LEP1GSC062_0632 [Leptospira alexanderi serovar Manhao 3 str. L 60]
MKSKKEIYSISDKNQINKIQSRFLITKLCLNPRTFSKNIKISNRKILFSTIKRTPFSLD